MSIPSRKEKLLREYKRVIARMSQDSHYEIRNKDVSRELGITTEKLDELLRNTSRAVSLTQPVNSASSGSFSTLESLIEDHHQSNPEALTVGQHLHDDLLHALDKIPSREASVISFRYGLKDGKGYTLKKTGKKFGVSSECIRQIEKRALNRIRHVRPYLEEYIIS